LRRYWRNDTTLKITQKEEKKKGGIK